MSEKNFNDENFGTRDKRGHWKPFGTIGINPPREIFFNPIKLFKYLFKSIKGGKNLLKKLTHTLLLSDFSINFNIFLCSTMFLKGGFSSQIL